MYGIFTIKRCTINSYHRTLSQLHIVSDDINYVYRYMDAHYTVNKKWAECDCEVEVREHLKAE